MRRHVCLMSGEAVANHEAVLDRRAEMPAADDKEAPMPSRPDLCVFQWEKRLGNVVQPILPGLRRCRGSRSDL